MPTEPNPLTTRIAAWLTANPGSYRANAVAEGLRADDPSLTNREVTNELARMARKGIVHRSRPVGVAASGPGARFEMLRD